MKIKCMIAFFLVFICTEIFALDMDNIVAYPVPFNPKKHSRLTIGYPSGSPGATDYSVKVEIFDINGDLVTKRSGSQFPVYWNGRNNSGRYVKPGMYIIRVEAVNDNDYGRKNIRILINY